MCEQVIDQQITLMNHRRRAFENESNLWKPEDTENAMRVYDFQDFLAQCIAYWEHLCRSRDLLLEHNSKCEGDHAKEFEQIDSAICNFGNQSAFALDVLDFIEQEYSVEHAESFRTVVEEAQLFCSDYDCSRSRTDISKWGE